MNKGLFLSLQERGLVQDFVPGLDELLNRQKVSVYAGLIPPQILCISAIWCPSCCWSIFSKPVIAPLHWWEGLQDA